MIQAWAVWALAQAVNLGVAGIFGITLEDVHYYFDGLAQPESGRLQEYPDASLWPLHAIFSLTGPNVTTFSWAFILMNAVLSGLFMWYLTKQETTRGARFWALFNLLLCPLILTRLDLAVGLFVALFVILCGTRLGALAPLVLAYATMMKLSPGVLAVTLVGKATSSKTWLRITTFAVGLVGFGLITASSLGLNRLLTPLTYQDVRGLQVESIFASPLVFAAALFPGTWHIKFAKSKSFEIFGPGVDVAILLSNVVMVGTLVFAIGVAFWQFLAVRARKSHWSRGYVLHMALAITMLLIVANKVFSPQYLMWAAPLVALALLRSDQWKLSNLFLGVTALSAVVFPWSYELLISGPAMWVALLLVVRNILVLITCWITVKESLTFLRQERATLASFSLSGPSAELSNSSLLNTGRK